MGSNVARRFTDGSEDSFPFSPGGFSLTSTLCKHVAAKLSSCGQPHDMIVSLRIVDERIANSTTCDGSRLNSVLLPQAIRPIFIPAHGQAVREHHMLALRQLEVSDHLSADSGGALPRPPEYGDGSKAKHGGSCARTSKPTAHDIDDRRPFTVGAQHRSSVMNALLWGMAESYGFRLSMRDSFQ